MTMPLFGVAGFPVNFFSSALGKKRDNIFPWLKEIGLDVLELQCTYGIKMPELQAIRYKQLAAENGITMTIHAPYYVNLGSRAEKTVDNSKNEIIKAYKLAEILGVKRIIFHPGGGHGKTADERQAGILQIINALNDIKPMINTTEISIYPEIGGKVQSLGSLDEIIQICKAVDYAFPCIDMAHLHAREIGSLKTKKDILKVLSKIEAELGRKTLEKVHFHMYPVDYTVGGEKAHKAFGDMTEGDDFHPVASDFIDAIMQKGLKPIVVCEAHNTQDVGAMLMRDLYNK